MEARAKEPGEGWVRPHARVMRERATRERERVRRARLMARAAPSVVARGARARESASPPSSRSSSSSAGRDPPRRNAGGDAGNDDGDSDPHDVAVCRPAFARSGGTP
jgi:hypothetical protein